MVDRSKQLQRRAAQRQKSSLMRGRTLVQSKGFAPRSRLAFRKKQEEQRLEEQERKKLNSIIKDIESGKVKSLSQIPTKYQEIIGVTQENLNAIQNYYKARKQADLWDSAFKLADEVLSSRNPSAIFRIGFSSNPYAREAYRLRKYELKAYKERKNIIKDIREGKITDVGIRNGRIVNTKTGVPITPSKASRKQIADLIQKDLPKGEKLILDRNYNIKGIDSKRFQQSIPYTKRAIERYSDLLDKTKFLDREDIIEQGMSIGVPEAKTTIGKVGRGITSFAVKGDSILNNFREKVQNKLKTFGVPINKIDNIQTRFFTKIKNDLDKVGLGGRDFEEYKKWMERRRDKLIKKYNRISKDRKEQIALYGELIRENPGVSDAELRRYIDSRLNIKSRGKKFLQTMEILGEIIAYKAATTLIDLGIATPILLKQIAKNPLTTLALLPPAVWQGLKSDFKTLKTGDGIAVSELIVEYYTLGKVFNLLGKTTGKVFDFVEDLSPAKKNVINGKIILRNSPREIFKVKGVPKLLKERVQKPSIFRPWKSLDDFIKGRKPGQFRKFTKDPGLFLKLQTLSSGSKPLSQQARLAGKEVTAVNAAADQLTSWIRRKRIIRKPIPGEANAPLKIKRLLKEFDSGKKLSFKEFVEVNRWFQKNSAPNITLLERSLYLDPASGLRFSRLGIEGERAADLIDLLTGNFKLRGNKPQILVFENARVAKFPKSLSRIKRKLLSGKKLTELETQRLIEWQVKKGFKGFKPIGSTIYSGGKELEVTLAPGELIKRIKRLGFIRYKGKKVNIVSAEVFKPSKKLVKRIALANKGKLTKNQLLKLERELSKKLGRKIRIETPKSFRRLLRRRDITKLPVLRLRGKSIFVIGTRKRSTNKKKIKKVKRKVKSITRTRKKISVRKITPKRKVTRKKRVVKKKPRVGVKKRNAKSRTRTRKRTPKRTTKRKVKRVKPRARPRPRPKPRARPRPRPRPRRSTRRKKPKVKGRLKRFSKRTLKKKEDVYYVVVKYKGRKRKLFPKPLTLKDAKDFLAYKVDNGLERTAWFEPIGKEKKVVRLPKSIKGYFSKNKKKLRPFRIRRGKKKEIIRGYIEKRKYALDTKREKEQLKRAKKRKPKKKKKIFKRKKVKRVPQRKVKRKPIKQPNKRKKPIRRKRRRVKSPSLRRSKKRSKLSKRKNK